MTQPIFVSANKQGVYDRCTYSNFIIWLLSPKIRLFIQA